MNDDSSFTIHGDEPVEARIVSWVLGEASAFEAAELERLCEERPELLVFRRRMRALHGLLTEAESVRPDEGWKLPPGKRKVLDEIFGEEKAVRLEVEKEKRVRHSGRRAFLAIAACLVITLVVLQLVVPVEYQSEAIIEVTPRGGGMSPLGNGFSNTSGSGVSPQFFGTEFEKIKSRSNLGKVVDNLDLDSRWGVDKDSAIRRLRDEVETRNVRGTDLLSIRAKEKDPQLAKDIANEVARNYRESRSEIEGREVERQLHELNKAVREQEDKVEERRKVLSTIARTKGIIYKGNDSDEGNDSSTREQAIKRGLDAQDYVDAKRELETDHELLQTMKLKQVAETIARKIPGESVQVHEEATKAVPSNPVRAAASKLAGIFVSGEEKSAVAAKASREKNGKKDMVALSTEFPPELIEGTPKPMNVPGLEAPASGPAGWSSREGTSDGRRIARPLAGKGQSEDIAMRHRKLDGVDVDMPVEPGAPSSSKAKVVAARTTSATAIPVPEVDVTTPSIDFGNVDDFGAGWGDGSGGGGGLSGEKPLAANAHAGAPVPTLELRHCDSSVSGGNIGGVINGIARIAGKNEIAAGERLPAVEEIPATGVLFGTDSKIKGGSIHTRITDRNGSADNPVRTNPALTYEHKKNVDEVRYSLRMAEGNLDLGKYDQAKEKYEEALRVDPYNSAARRGLEKVASSKTDYHRAAYDQTRAELLSQVDNAWELSVPADGEKSHRGDLEGFVNHGAPIVEAAKENMDAVATDHEGDPFSETSKVAASGKRSGGKEYEIHTGYSSEYLFRGSDLGSPDEEARSASGLAGRESGRRQSTVAESDKLLAYARSANAKGDYEKAYETYEKALNLLPDAPLLEERRDLLRKSLGDASVALSASAEKAGIHDESKLWLNKAREWDPSNAQARKQLIADVSSEIPAAEDPYSTFSLNISDASFQVAQAALAKGETPDPAGIKVEQFYNAVDYGDPSPSAGEPVAVSIEQSAHPVIPGRNLVRIALKTAAAGRSASQPLRLTLLVDQSGSMVREDRRAAMDKALAGLSELLTENDLVTVIGFSRTPHLLADGMAGDKADKLAELVNQAASEGGTNLEEAIKLGEQLADRRKLAGAQNRIVLFTDGAANLGNADPDRLAEKVKQLRQKGIAFDIAGIAADGLNDELLGELARNGNGRYYVVGKGADSDFAKQLAGAFRPAAENVKVQVRFNPERVGRYKLIGFEKDRLKTEDFRNDKVDAAELAAEEAGVAIYQVEPLPGGRGELGEVSVRFRDTASDQMVERTWTVPHDTRAPVLDRAAPSMQLAVLSMLAGEKLKGGPLAEAIDFKQLAAPAANVRRFYGNTGRVGEMLHMVDVLK